VRTVIASVTLSLDGFSAGPAGDLAGLVEEAGSDETMTWFEGVFRGADTALLGRTNYEGFHEYWPPVAHDPASSPRGRDLAVWLDEVEKVVFSRTLTEATWSNARIAGRRPAEEVAALRDGPGRDIIVLNSASIIRALLEADLVDRLCLRLAPVTLGGGLRIFPEDVPRAAWELSSVATLTGGTLGLWYGRRRILGA
jgi:dihydrofolate reductase